MTGPCPSPPPPLALVRGAGTAAAVTCSLVEEEQRKYVALPAQDHAAIRQALQRGKNVTAFGWVRPPSCALGPKRC